MELSEDLWVLSMQHSSLNSVLCTQPALISPNSQVLLLNSGNQPDLLGLPLSAPWLGNSLKAVSWGNLGLTSFILNLSGFIIFSFLDLQCIENHCFIHFSVYFVVTVLEGKVNSDPITPSWQDEDVINPTLINIILY